MVKQPKLMGALSQTTQVILIFKSKEIVFNYHPRTKNTSVKEMSSKNIILKNNKKL